MNHLNLGNFGEFYLTVSPTPVLADSKWQIGNVAPLALAVGYHGYR